MKKHEKLRKEADALEEYADMLAANCSLFKDVVTHTEDATNLLLDNEITPEAIEIYRAKIHRMNLYINTINRTEQYASAHLRAELKKIESEYQETNERSFKNQRQWKKEIF